MQTLLKHRLKTTDCLIFRSLSTLVNPNSFLDTNFSSLGNVAALDDHKENHLNLFDLDLLAQLQPPSHGSICSSYALNKLISSCASSRSLQTGTQIHSFVIKMGFHSHVYISTALVDMYGKCGVISDAQKLFDETPHRNVITWNSLISGYLHTNYIDVSIDLFLSMLRLEIHPTHFTISTVLVGCSLLKTPKLGEQVHGLSTKLGFLFNIVVCTSLLETYWKCSNINDSKRIFDEIPDKNLVVWTSMINGYTQNQQTNMAIYMLKEMLVSCHKPNSITYNTLLSSLSSLHDIIYCEQIHSLIIKQGLDSDVYLAVTLLTVYSKCGNLQDFQTLCTNLPVRNNITCNAIISGYSNMGNDENALGFFSEMRQERIDTDFFTFSTVLKAIGVISAFKEGKKVHGLIVKSGQDSNIYIQNGLISMYAKCGNIKEAKHMFNSMMEHDTISWNSLLSGYAQHGYGKEAVEFFEKMKNTKVNPDLTTFLIVISACGHVGLVNKGLEYFKLMRSNYGEPKGEHYACVVDLYSRAGFVEEAEVFVDNLGMEVGPAGYKALLSACRVYGNKEIGLRVSRKIVDLFPDDPSVYVQVSNVLASDGCWHDSARMHNLICSKGIKKKVGCSWI